MQNIDMRSMCERLVETCRDLTSAGLNHGTSGNASFRVGDKMYITPTSMRYDVMTSSDIIEMNIDTGETISSARPSSEWPFHRALYRAREEFHAVVHTHSTYATTLSMLRKDIPACHYMIAAFGGPTVRCSAYATYGSEELSAHIVKAMENRSACLIGTHGMVTCGETLEQAFWRAEELESLARQYYLTIQSGLSPVILSDDEIRNVMEKMAGGYGRRDL